MFKYLFKPLGMDAFKASTPNFWELPVVSGIVEGVAGLSSAAIQAKTQKSANEAYLKGVRETNEANKELYREQVRDNRANTALENAYNTPVAQLSRLRQAGINTYGGDSGNSMQIASATPQSMKAPEQTPNPYGNLNLQGITSEVIRSAQMANEYNKTKEELYRAGIENQFVAQHEVIKLQGELSDLLSKGITNQSDYVRYKMLVKDLDYYDKYLDQRSRQNEETIRNINASTESINSAIIRDDKLAVMTMKHMDKQDAIGWYNALSTRVMARAEQKRVDDAATAMWNNMEIALQDANDRHEAMQYAKNMRSWFFSLSAEEREFARTMMLYNIEHAKISLQDWYNKSNSPVRKFMESTFGFNLDEILSGSASYSLGGVKPKE